MHTVYMNVQIFCMQWSDSRAVQHRIVLFLEKKWAQVKLYEWSIYLFQQVWLKFARWFCRKGFLKFLNLCSLFRYYFPLGQGMVFHLKKKNNLNPLHPKMLGWNWPNGSGQEYGNLNSLQRQQRQLTTTTDKTRAFAKKAKKLKSLVFVCV